MEVEGGINAETEKKSGESRSVRREGRESKNADEVLREDFTRNFFKVDLIKISESGSGEGGGSGKWGLGVGGGESVKGRRMGSWLNCVEGLALIFLFFLNFLLTFLL